MVIRPVFPDLVTYVIDPNFLVRFFIFYYSIVHSRSPGSRYFVNNFREERATLIFLYHREARQMPEMIKHKALQLEPVLESYGACKFSHIFPMEKPFNYNPLKLVSEHMFMTCM